MSNSPIYGLPKPTLSPLQPGYGYSRTSYLALGTSYPTNGSWVGELAGSAEKVIVIDEVNIVCQASCYKGTLNATYTSAAQTTLVMTAAIPTSTPQVGVLYVRRTTTGLNNAVSSIAYSSYTGSTFTIASTDFSGSAATSGTVVTAASDTVVTLKINNVEIPIHIPASAQDTTTETFTWKPKGNLVVTSTSAANALNAKCSAASTAWVSMRFRHIPKSLAMMQWKGGGIPLIAVSGTTVAATAKQMVAPLAGHHVEVLSILLTGNSPSNAASNDFRIGFWNGTAGTTFTNAEGGKMIFRAFARGERKSSAPTVVINDTKGCITGPEGYGVYAQATTGLAGTNPNCDCVILYRYVKGKQNQFKSQIHTTLTGSVTSVRVKKNIPMNLPPVGTITIKLTNGTTQDVAYTSYATHTFTIGSTALEAVAGGDVTCLFSATDVAVPSGKMGGNTFGKKWWALTESIAGFATATGETILEAYASGKPTGGMQIRGYAVSYLGSGVEGSSPAITHIGAGTAIDAPVTPIISFNNNSNFGSAQTVSKTVVMDDVIIPLSTSQDVAVNGADPNGSPTVTSRAVLVWGTMDGKKQTGIEYVRTQG